MRIAFVTTGLVRYTSLIANPMSEKHDVCFVGLDFRQEVAEGQDFPRAVRFWFDPRIPTLVASKWRKRDPRNLLAVWTAVRFLRKWEPDIIHIQVDYDYRIFLTLAGLWHVPCVDTVHDAQPHLGEYKSYSRKPDWQIRHLTRRHAKHFIIHGEAIKNRFCRENQIAPERVSVIPHPAYELYRRFEDPRIVQTRNEVLFFGRIWQYKGLDLFIQAEPLVSAAIPNVKFLIAGQGQDLGPYRAMMAHPERFEIYNRFLTDPEVTRLFQRAALVVAPYREASQSGVVTIACALGRPVIVTNVGSLTEVVRDNETGLVVPPNDPTALAEAIVRLLRDHDLRHKMGQLARALGQSELSVRSIANQTFQVYNLVLEGRKHSVDNGRGT
jgi:glycosyltransferase involved in cell wall biosynthesis